MRLLKKNGFNWMNKLREASINLILANQADSGGYVASPNFRVYRYSWYRDGAFIAHAIAKVGHNESAMRFHNWAAENIIIRADQISGLIQKRNDGIEIHSEEHLHCRYTLDNKESQEEWTNYQLDGFGTWIWSVDEFFKMGNPRENKYIQATELLIPYLSTFWRDGQFDWWEESFGHQHVSTIGSIAAGLQRCSTWPEISVELRDLAFKTAKEIREFVLSKGVHNGHLTKWLGTNEVDGSLAALISPLGFIEADSPIAKATIDQIRENLGLLGTHRHLKDVYFGGGEWLILSSFLALSLLENGDMKSAQEVLLWIESQSDENNELPEQVDENLLFPEAKDDWVAKWGESAKPLLWSHAMYLLLQNELSKVLI